MLSYLPSIPIRLPANWTLTCSINDECYDEEGNPIYGIFEKYTIRAPESEELILYVSISKMTDGNTWDADEMAHVKADEYIKANTSVNLPSSSMIIREKEIGGMKIYFFSAFATDGDGYDLYGFMKAPDGNLVTFDIALKTQYKEDNRNPEVAIDFLANLIVL